MVFGNGVKNIQAAAYNGARTVTVSKIMLCIVHFDKILDRFLLISRICLPKLCQAVGLVVCETVKFHFVNK